MAYLPKNIYTKKTAGKGEFMLKRNSKPFIGTYIELSDGTFQSGTIYGKGELLVPVRKTKNPGTYLVNNKGLHLDITTRKNAFDYTKLKETIQKEHDKFQPIYFTKPFPTAKEYKKGQFRRYFALRKNTVTDYKEINKEIYEDIRDEKGTYDYNLYEVGFTPWVLTDNNTTANSKLIERLNRAFPNVGSILFSDLSEYYLPDSLFRPKTQMEEIAFDNNLKDPNPLVPSPEPIKEISISGEDPRLEKVKKEIEEETENIARKRTKHSSKQKRIKPKLRREFFKKAKPLLKKRKLKGTKTSGAMLGGGASSGGSGTSGGGSGASGGGGGTSGGGGGGY